jgi:predicted nucleic-acid-binding Zn-ribbon protein
MTKSALTFTEQGTSLTVAGKTFLIKDNIKSLGGRWNPATKTWTISTADMPADMLATKKLLLDAYAAAEAEKAATVMTVSKALALGSNQWNWICCEHCVVHDWYRQHTTCSTHANIHPSGYGTDFRVRGILYYGD